MWWAPVASFLNGLWGYVLLGVSCAAAGGYATYHFEESKVLAVQLADAKDYAAALDLQNKAVKSADAESLKAAVAEAAAQQKIVTVHQVITEKVPVYVHDKALPCIPFGLVRVLDASVLQTGPDALPLPAGQSDDACAPVDANALAQAILANYSAAEGNAEQLTAVQGWITAQKAAQP